MCQEEIEEAGKKIINRFRCSNLTRVLPILPYPYLPPTLPKESSVTVYCDESSHCPSVLHPYMVIGSLWVPSSEKVRITNDLKNLLKRLGLNSEVKWRKVSAKKLSEYKQLIDFFFNNSPLRFRAVIVENSKVDLTYHNNDHEKKFYKFYYQLLKHWLDNKNDYLILLDGKKNKDKSAIGTLQQCLKSSTGKEAQIKGVSVVCSTETRLIQLTDLLTGAVAASFCGFKWPSPKQELALYIAYRLGKENLIFSSPYRGSHPKFNLFQWTPTQ